MRNTPLHPSWRSPILFALFGSVAVFCISLLILDGGHFARSVAAFMAGAWVLNLLIIRTPVEAPTRSDLAVVRVSWLVALLATFAYSAWRGE